jgi:hypothetical protein
LLLGDDDDTGATASDNYSYKNIPCSRVILEELTVPQLVKKKNPYFM